MELDRNAGRSYEHAPACWRTRVGACMPRRARELCQGREARAALCVTEFRAHARSPPRARPARLRPRRASAGACRAMRALRAGPVMLGQREQRWAAAALQSYAVRRSLTEAPPRLPACAHRCASQPWRGCITSGRCCCCLLRLACRGYTIALWFQLIRLPAMCCLTCGPRLEASAISALENGSTKPPTASVTIAG